MKFLKTFLAALLAFVVGSVVLTILGVVILFGITASMGASERVVIGENSILKIDFSELVTDAPVRSPFGRIDFATFETTPTISLYNALKAIETAKTDDRIRGIYLRPGGAYVPSLTVLEELREALADFRRSGKFVVAYSEAYGQPDYYLASVADKIYMQPQGRLMWSGMSATMPFFKGLFDKLDVEAEIFRPTECRFKSAVEPYFRTDMSDENRLQMQTLLDSNWTVVLESVAKSRGVDPVTLNRLADELVIAMPSDAVAHKLIDSLLYEDQLEEVFRSRGVEAKEGEMKFVTLCQYAANRRADLKKIHAPQVAIVYAEGAIVDGKGSSDEIGGNSMAAQLAKVRRDTTVKAVVLRVNSPGGSALASDVIWREMQLLKAAKPIVVSMGQYAASGGYYISCPADAIVADRMTLTGSIGVFGMFLRMDEMLSKHVGITFDTAKTNESSDAGVMRPLTERERAVLMRNIDDVYATFTGLVAQGRHLPIERVKELAEGRVWSGTDAVANGLADLNGGLNAAIALAAEKATLGDNYRVVERVEAPTGLVALFSDLSAQVRTDIADKELGIFAPHWRKLREVSKQQGVLMYCPYSIEIE